MYGLMYHAIPSMSKGKIGHVQFYITNIGLFLMLSALAMLLKESTSVEVPLAIGEICAVLALALFMFNLWHNRAV